MWELELGDVVRLRPKRAFGGRVETTVARLLERDRANGLGFVNETDIILRQYYYDVEVSTSPAP